MGYNSALEKIRALAAADAGLQAYLGTGPFRWFAWQLQPGYPAQGACVRAAQISAVYGYAQDGQLCIEQARIQFDCYDQNEATCRELLLTLKLFLQGLNLMTDEQFQSPPVTPSRYPNYELSESGPVPEIQQSLQLWVWTTDWRIFNNTLIT